MKSDEKTNVMRLLESRKIPYTAHTYDPDPSLSGEEIAQILGEDASHVFKTLVTRGKTGRFYVFVIPVACELNLKKAAAAAGEKSVEMIHQKELLPLTGYVHGGCSPVGMKKPFPTFVHAAAEGMDRFFVSAGRVGFQVELSPEDLAKMVRFRFADLVS
jgi:Cys-tRNA(Pro)/Cys-tRNA(Cys) deacylase